MRCGGVFALATTLLPALPPPPDDVRFSLLIQTVHRHASTTTASSKSILTGLGGIVLSNGPAKLLLVATRCEAQAILLSPASCNLDFPMAAPRRPSNTVTSERARDMGKDLR